MKQIIIDDPEMLKKFWARVNTGEPNLCWNWTGRKRPTGYGRFRFEGGDYFAHRVAYMISNHIDYLDSKRDLIIQTCGNHLCCNPKHLVLLLAQGLQHALAKDGPMGGFAQRGEKNYSARLTEEQVREIKALYASKAHTQKEIAAMYGVARTTVSAIVRGVWWKWLDK